MTRYARYAGAVLFALLAVGFAALWVRSYKTADVTFYGSSGSLVLRIVPNRGIVTVVLLNAEPSWDERGWNLFHFPAEPRGDRWERTFWGFGFANHAGTHVLFVPHYFLVIASASIAALFAFNRTWRFSLRGLLITMTLFAAALGLLVYVV